MQASDSTEDVLAAVDTLACDFLARYRDGDRPTVEEYAKRHPEYSDSIRQMFPLVASIERIKIDEQVAEDGTATLAGRELSQLGDFRIVREIGRGGMGIVFEAHQESLDRVVAIKVLPKQSLLDDDALERFRTEATTAAAMHHTNIVPIYGTGEADGSHYLVMQLVKGKSLDSVISDGPQVTCDEVARIGLQISDAIAYSHESGVLHRDIKPANILIEKNGTIQVTDFGLAKNVGSDLTATRSVSGSLRYMAPERFSGVSAEAGDIYGIGITLYELLAGQPAFEASNTEHLISSITHARLKPIKVIRPDVPADLSTIVGKAIQVDPAQRYGSAADLRDDLQRFLNDEPIHARRTPLWGRLVRWIRRNPRLAAAVGTAAFALVAGTIISSIAYLVASAANQRSVDALQSSEQTVDLTLRSLDGVIDVVTQTPTSANLSLSETFEDDDLLPNVDLKPSPTSAKILERLQPIYERLSQQSPTRSDIVLRRVDSSVQLARIQHSLGRTSDGISTLETSIELLKQSGSPAAISKPDLQLRLARLNNELGALFAAEFNRSESMRCYESAVEAASHFSSSTKVRPNTAGLTELARAHLNLGNPPPQLRRSESPTSSHRSDGLQHINRAIEILEELRSTETQTKTTNILYAGSLLARSRLAGPGPELNQERGSRDQPRGFSEWRNSKQRDFQAAVTILRDQLTATPDDSAVRFELVETLADVNLRGRRSPRLYKEADDRLTEALQEIGTLRSGNSDNAVYLATEVHLRHKLSAIAKSRFRFAEAEDLLREAIRLQTLLILTWPDNVRHRCWRAMLYRSQAMLYRQWEKPDAADAALTNATADMEAIDPQFAEHPLVVRTLEAIRGDIDSLSDES
ncbi:Serine/threonine protein kinase [Neorhodopirellula lusitana]|uniref:Serine/threonine protein kinase n=1 Tax=Neorhodopirellula lusitana TaxID=445327 RepID=A0ABY1QH05_9BACT|nr:serine/threonine-protein kinase [Neorhodopirellula lusitana]SMP71341.1 Serine/threonine protein kinase [Neorhodopirellula lusitana]